MQLKIAHNFNMHHSSKQLNARSWSKYPDPKTTTKVANLKRRTVMDRAWISLKAKLKENEWVGPRFVAFSPNESEIPIFTSFFSPPPHSSQLARVPLVEGSLLLPKQVNFPRMSKPSFTPSPPPPLPSPHIFGRKDIVWPKGFEGNLGLFPIEYDSLIFKRYSLSLWRGWKNAFVFNVPFCIFSILANSGSVPKMITAQDWMNFW